MKKFTNLYLFTLATLVLTGCEVIGGIFKAGVWSGVIVVAIVIALLIWIISKFTGGRGNPS